MEYDGAYALLLTHKLDWSKNMMTKLCLMLLMHIRIHIIPRHTMHNLSVALEDEDIMVILVTLEVEEIYLVEKHELFLKIVQ